MKHPILTASIAAACLSVCLAAPAAAAWPDRAITLIVPGAPGGTTDLPARMVANKMAQSLGQPVIVENRAGSGGVIGVQALLRAPADGYTFVVGNTGSNAINYSVYKQLAYKPADLVPITDMISFDNVLVVAAQSPIASVSDLIARMKQPDSHITYASAGIGQTTHLTAEMLRVRSNGAADHVPYKGSSPATMAVMAGEVDFMFDNLTQASPHIQGGKLRALATTGTEPHADLSGVPTMQQAGLDDFVVKGWLGLFAAAGTPPEVISSMHAAFAAALRDPEVDQRFRQMGGVPGGMPQAQFAALVDGEIKRWGEITQSAGIRLD